MNEPTIDPNEVDTIFLDCLFKDGEDTSNYIEAKGITTNIGFHPERINSYKIRIAEILNELPDQFKKSNGGGWSFLQACDDKNGNQWTGLHRNMEQLFQLGIGIGKVKCQLPRELWAALPGGMPYYVIE